MRQLTTLFREIFSCASADAQNMVETLLSRHYRTLYRSDRYTYAPGDIPLMLVAHTDTVHDSPPDTLCFDPAQQIAWSPQGLGADDRAGIYAIALLLERGLRPHVLLTDCEETGGQGAQDVVCELDAPDAHALIQLDRMNSQDAVYYSCNCKPLRRWATKHGFTTAQGSFSDISVLMPAWGIAGVNLSVGYYAQHTTGEYLRTDELESTVDKVARMLQNPPKRRFVYRDYRPEPVRPWLGCTTRDRDNNDTWEREYDRLLREHEDRDNDLLPWSK